MDSKTKSTLRDIDQKLSEGNHIEELRWLKNCLTKEVERRKIECKVATIEPPNETITNSLNNETVKQLLIFLELDPPSNSNPHWKIPSSISSQRLQSKSNIVKMFLHVQLERCKSCEVRYNFIVMHLSKNERCKKNYSKDEYNELLEMAKTRKKQKADKWQKKNKDLVAKTKAKRYCFLFSYFLAFSIILSHCH